MSEINKKKEKIRFSPFNEQDFKDFLPMAQELWGDYFSKEILTKEFQRILTSQNELGCICKMEAEAIGFITMSLRVDPVPKATTKPVAYLEGIYVKEKYRKFGIAKKLYEIGENWAKSKGCTQIGSDTWDWNKNGIAFHEKLGFKITYTLVHFIKNI